MQLTILEAGSPFPPPSSALREPNGLLAVGADLSVPRLLSAYQQGIFPWFSEGEPILWWSPDPRGVIFTKNYKSPKSLVKHIKKHAMSVTCNQCFDVVIDACAKVPRRDNGTWITSSMVQAYKRLHLAGWAHSIEVWHHEQLVGGLYGVFANNVFCGESMFSLESNASKVALHGLIAHLRKHDVQLVDCQMQNPHLKMLGCEELERADFLSLLAELQKQKLRIDWIPQELDLGI